MKATKKILCMVLSILVIFSAVLPVGAASVWDVFWNDTDEAKMALIMQPGADETERRFSWYMPEGTEVCSVEISKNPLMAGAGPALSGTSPASP